MAQELFVGHHIEKSCALLVENSGYNKAYSNAISLLANVTADFLRQISMNAQIYTELVGNRETTVENVLMAGLDYGVKTSDLIQYVKSNESFTNKTLPFFPVSDESITAKLSRSQLPGDILDGLCNGFCSTLKTADNSDTSFGPDSLRPSKGVTAEIPPRRKTKVNPIIRPLRNFSTKSAEIFEQLHNDKRPFDFDSWEVSAAELKLLTMPPICHETTDDMANAVKPPSYWEKRNQTFKYQNNYNWADDECSSDSEISLIESVVLSPRPIDDPTPPLKLRDAIEISYANPSESVIRKERVLKKNNNNNNAVVKKCIKRKISPRPGITMVLRRRAPVAAPKVDKSDYSVVFCSTKSKIKKLEGSSSKSK